MVHYLPTSINLLFKQPTKQPLRIQQATADNQPEIKLQFNWAAVGIPPTLIISLAI